MRDCRLKEEGGKILVSGKTVSFAEEDEDFYDPDDHEYEKIWKF